MTVELYLVVVDDSGAGGAGRAGPAGGPSAAPVRSIEPDAQLLLAAPVGPVPACTVPSVFVGELPRDAGTSVVEGTPPIAVRVEAVLGNAERVIDEALIEQVLLAFDAEGAPGYRMGSPVDVWQFLRVHEGARMRAVRRPGSSPVGTAMLAAMEPTEATGSSTVAVVVDAPSGVGEPRRPAGWAPTGVGRWSVVADWLTLATLRAVVLGIVALHLFVLIGEAIIATP